MIRWVALLLLCSSVRLFALTNINHIQPWASASGSGGFGDSITWTAQGTDFDLFFVDTNYQYKLPYWVQLQSTNYDAVMTKWLAFGSNAQGKVQRAQGLLNTFTSNMWIGCYWKSTMNNSGSDVNLDLFELNSTIGGGGNYGVVQYAVRSGTSFLSAHCAGGEAGATNGHSINVPNDGRIYWMQMGMNRSNASFTIRLFDATNNFSPVANAVGTYESTGGAIPGTNVNRIYVNANYLNLSAGKVTGTNWLSSLIIGYDQMPGPEHVTNSIPLDRYFKPQPYETNTTVVTVGIRDDIRNRGRPLETNLTFYGGDINAADNTAALQAAINAAGEFGGTTILIDGTNKITGTISTANKGSFTIKGTNNGTLMVLGSPIKLGPTALTAGQAKLLYPLTGAFRGMTSCVLTTNMSVTNAGPVKANEMYEVVSYYDSFPFHNPNMKRLNTLGFGTYSQRILILSTNGNTITFTPPLTEDFTNSAYFIQKYSTVVATIGVENMGFTMSNALGNAIGGNTDRMLQMQGLKDSWVTGCTFENGRNYAATFENCVHSDFGSNRVFRSMTSGTSHGGLLLTGTSGMYVYNNIFHEWSPSIQSFGSDRGNFFLGNYFTNTDGRIIIYHEPGAGFDHYEHNISEGVPVGSQNGGNYIADSYFGNVNNNSFLRNRFEGATLNRFSQYHTFLGNVLGSTNYSLRYDMYASGNTYEVYPIGFPNIGNLTTNANQISKPDGSGAAWNYPGSFNAAYTNIYYKFTNVAAQVSNGTNILGNFTHWPPPASLSGAYAFTVQFGSDTNKYRTIAFSYHTNTATELSFLSSFNFTNDETLLLAGPTMYQQRQTLDLPTHLRSYNRVTTNSTEAVAHDPVFLPRSVPVSLAVTNKPWWWGSVSYPGVDPESATFTNPARERFATMDAVVGVSYRRAVGNRATVGVVR